MKPCHKPIQLEHSTLPLANPCKYSRYLYFNIKGDNVSELTYASSMEERLASKFKYVYDRVVKQCYLIDYKDEFDLLTPEEQMEVMFDGSWKERQDYYDTL